MKTKSTVHFAAFKENLIIGGVSLIKNNTNKIKSLSNIQLRGMAVYKDLSKKQNWLIIT